MDDGTAIDALILMLRRKERNNDVYLAAIDYIISTYGRETWENDFNTFRKQLRKWMTDKTASPMLTKYIMDEYENVVNNL